MKTKPNEQDLQIAIECLRESGCSELYVFGSAATGRISDESDIDIAVRGILPEKFFEVYGELLMRTSRPVDLVELNMQENFGHRLIKLGCLKRVA